MTTAPKPLTPDEISFAKKYRAFDSEYGNSLVNRLISTIDAKDAEIARLKAELSARLVHYCVCQGSQSPVEGCDCVSCTTKRLENRIADLEETIAVQLALVHKQAEDEGLWFIAQTAPEAYLQQELRRLHSAIEANAASPRDE